MFFLLVDLYILTYQAEKALHLLVVLGKNDFTRKTITKNGKNECECSEVIRLNCIVCLVFVVTKYYFNRFIER